MAANGTSVQNYRQNGRAYPTRSPKRAEKQRSQVLAGPRKLAKLED